LNRDVVIARRRVLKDRLATVLVNAAGVGVIALVLLMLGYLLSVVLPLLNEVEVGPPVLQEAPADAEALRAHGFSGGDELVLIDGERGRRWHISRDAHYRCAASGARRSLAAAGAPLRAASLAEQGDTVLVLDASAALHRFAVSGDGCRLSRLGPALPQPAGFDTLLSELARPVTLLIDSGAARLRVLHGVSGDELFQGPLPGGEGAGEFRLSADGQRLWAQRGGELLRWQLRNPFPEANWRALWLPQQYPGYASPAQVWHPAASGVGAVAKHGLSPLLYGTFKAALYGMLVAVPLSLGAAIYTGYFLPTVMRNRIKPTVEMIEAFPTVVLGFIAGLWLAPLLSDYLMLVFLLPLLFLLLPLLLTAAHLLLQRMSPRFVTRPPRVRLLVAGYLLCVLAALYFSPSLERLLFDGSLHEWLLRVTGIDYEQRNVLLVGFAMGLALVPTLFSIVEDAIFAVPRALSDGSLALGATRWQSLARVVLPAAAPALLSAMLIGFARGLGETMIVLLATGNTPIMDPSAFTGLRSLSASLAIELPEAVVGGLQFRVLFLASLVLFALTFLLNTVAELFRQRLRYRYAGR
jgi:phosphate transport system permease protein